MDTLTQHHNQQIPNPGSLGELQARNPKLSHAEAVALHSQKIGEYAGRLADLSGMSLEELHNTSPIDGHPVEIKDPSEDSYRI